jgi:hypothetical protein
MPERPHTTRDREKENMTQVAAQPICTMAGSPCRHHGSAGNISHGQVGPGSSD